jgi:uncharacterized protein (TIGR03437 family)
MERRKFLRAGIAAAAALAARSKSRAAEVPEDLTRRPRRPPVLALHQLTTATQSFPSVTPLFAGILLPSAASPTIMSDSWSDFQAQVQTQANAGYRLSCFVTIQNFNRTFYYAACQPGTGAWQLMQVQDGNSFANVVANYQNQYYLADFNIAFENEQLMYYAYLLEGTRNQSLQGPYNYSNLRSEWNTLSTAASPSQMVRVQAYPTSNGAMYLALFEAGPGSYPFHQWPVFLGTTTNLSTSQSFESQVQSLSSNTLTGICYEPVDGYLAGCWGQLQNGAQYFQDLTWAALSALVQTGRVPVTLTVYPDAPDWDDYFEANLAPQVMGYAYAVAKNGQTILTGGGGLARGPNEASNPNQPFTPDTRINLASVSKAITGVGLEIFVGQVPEQSFQTPFLTTALTSRLSQTPTSAASQVTLGQLASMTTGLFEYPPDGTGSAEGPPDINFSVGSPPQKFGPYPTIWADISDYLAQTPNNPPSYDYNNTNYAILQVYMELVLSANPSDPQDYLNYLTTNVLLPAGITSAITAAPDSQEMATLSYSGAADTGPGYYREAFTMVGASGWVGSVQGLIALMNALRATALLSADTIGSMFVDAIGAWVSQANPFGTAYFKEGSLTTTVNGETKGLNTAVLRLPEGYDLAIVANSAPAQHISDIALNAFIARGLSTTNLPSGPVVMATVSSASYLPNVAPGGFVSIFGSGLIATPAEDWTNAITGGNLPTELGGVTVRINGAWASIAYVSATQINCILPSSVPAGTMNVEIATPLGGMSPEVTVAAVAPAFFTYQASGTEYAVAVFNQTSLVYVNAPGAIPGETSRPAMAGDYLQIFGTGMGPTSPGAPDGVVLTMAYPANIQNFAVTIGGLSAPVIFGGLVYAGVYQVDIQVPAGVAGGAQPILLSVNGVASATGVMITMQAQG